MKKISTFALDEKFNKLQLKLYSHYLKLLLKFDSKLLDFSSNIDEFTFIEILKILPSLNDFIISFPKFINSINELKVNSNASNFLYENLTDSAKSEILSILNNSITNNS